MMRIIRGIAAALVWVLATVVLLLSVILCVTVILLPLGIPLLLVGLRLYGYGVQLIVPRAPEVRRRARKKAGLRARGSVDDDLRRGAKRAKKAVLKRMRGTGKRVRKRFRRRSWLDSLVPGR